MNAKKLPRGNSLSVAIVVRDDESVLAQSLASVRQLAQEIVVLDTGAADRTAEIVKAAGATLVRSEYQNDGSADRNSLLSRLSSRWVLWLEPGEKIDAGSAAELKKFVAHDADPNTVYAIMVQQPVARRDASPEQAALLRLMPNRPELRFEGRVRETFRPSAIREGLSTAMAPGLIRRSPRELDRGWKSVRAWQRLDLASLEIAASQSPNLRALLAMGEAAADLEDHAMARQAFSEVVRIASRGSLEMLEGYYGLLASFDGEPGDSQRQLAVCLEALEIFPLDTQLLLAMGTYLQMQSQLKMAAKAFDVARQFGRVSVETWHLADIDQVVIACLSLTLQLDGNESRARQVLEDGLARWPGSLRLGRRLLDLYIKSGCCEEAVKMLQKMPWEPAYRMAMENVVRGACLALEQQWTSALALLQSAYLVGCDEVLCYRWLSAVLLATGQTSGVEPILARWRQIEPESVELNRYMETLTQERSRPTGGTASASQGRWRRIDAATVSLDAMATHIPMISQVTSAD